MMNELFAEVLRASKQLRPDYPSSLGTEHDGWHEVFTGGLGCDIPPLFATIYGNVSGTKRAIEDQKLMDFIPGYRLIHIEEFIHEKKMLANVAQQSLNATELLLPILTNYSSDFVVYFRSSRGEEKICHIMRDEGNLVVMHGSPDRFLMTVHQFYAEGVYFLDEDGYLDYDFQMQATIGARLNRGLAYWQG